MGSHPLPVPPPLHHYRILIHHLPHRGSRHHSASAPSRHRFHFRILTAPVPMTWLQESAVTVNTVDTTGRARQLAAVHPSRCRAGRVRRAEPLFREATDSHASAWDVLRPIGTTVHTFGVEDGSHTVPASRSTVCSSLQAITTVGSGCCRLWRHVTTCTVCRRVTGRPTGVLRTACPSGYRVAVSWGHVVAVLAVDGHEKRAIFLTLRNYTPLFQ